MVAVLVARRRGHTLDSLREAAVASVGSGIGAIFILLAVGSLIGTWAMSGTLGAMVYYGLQLLSPNYFYMTAALICAVISASMDLRSRDSWRRARSVSRSIWSAIRSIFAISCCELKLSLEIISRLY